MNGVGLEAAAKTRMIDIGGRRLALTCSGSGSPAVVLETGLGAESADWAAVQRGVEEFARVCRYDRSGRGASDSAPTPRTAADLADDLRQLLWAGGVPAPYVLVGQSLGGLLARVFAQRYAGEVAGIVLVDSMHERQFEVFGSMFPAPSPSDPPALAEIRAFWSGGWRNPESTAERLDLQASIRQGCEVRSLGRIPLRVIAAGTFANNPLVPAARREELQRHWEDLQKEFLSLCPLATLTHAPHSGHFIQRDDPRIVIDAVRAVIDQVRGDIRRPPVQLPGHGNRDTVPVGD